MTILDAVAITIGQTSVLTGQGSGDANTLQGIKASLGQTATIQSMSIYFKAASGLVRLSIYDDKGNYPGTLKAQTAQFTPSVGWNTQNVTSPVTLSAGNYWLIWQTDNNSIGVAYTPGTRVHRHRVRVWRATCGVPIGWKPESRRVNLCHVNHRWSQRAAHGGDAGLGQPQPGAGADDDPERAGGR